MTSQNLFAVSMSYQPKYTCGHSYCWKGKTAVAFSVCPLFVQAPSLFRRYGPPIRASETNHCHLTCLDSAGNLNSLTLPASSAVTRRVLSCDLRRDQSRNEYAHCILVYHTRKVLPPAITCMEPLVANGTSAVV